MTVKIDFFVPGFSKCGTTTLFEVLNAHPEIFIPDAKEPNFFGSEIDAERQTWYESLFQPAKPNQTIGECSTFYSSIYAEKAASKEMFANNPQAKLIFIARDPVDRIESSFREMHNSAPKFGLNTPFELENALLDMPQLLADTSFSSRLNVHLEQFGRKNVLLIFMEDLKIDVAAVATRCYQFLGLQPYDFIADRLPHKNKGEDKLYDSRLLRWSRCNSVVGPLLGKIDIDRQDRIFKRIGLRRPFTQKVVWSDKAKKIAQECLKEDIEKFLHYAGEQERYWPKFQALMNE